ncbi:MAG TPA: hypothetical protein VFQ30_15970 [Ktedonobacteraceae bacterium]|nr:hypothetical protein [Ktedonobacteraceae bacterium]
MILAHHQPQQGMYAEGEQRYGTIMSAKKKLQAQTIVALRIAHYLLDTAVDRVWLACCWQSEPRNAYYCWHNALASTVSHAECPDALYRACDVQGAYVGCDWRGVVAGWQAAGLRER